MIEESKIKNLGNIGIPTIREPGNAVKVHTGLWRTHKPVIDLKKCISCKICWINCPVTAIRWQKQKPKGNPKVDYYYCKGCHICANVCPVKCIKMVEE